MRETGEINDRYQSLLRSRQLSDVVQPYQQFLKQLPDEKTIQAGVARRRLQIQAVIGVLIRIGLIGNGSLRTVSGTAGYWGRFWA